MKKLFFWLLLSLPFAGYSQFDDQFYHPSNQWNAEKLPPHTDVWVVDGADSVYAAWCKPEGEILGVVFYCHGNSGNVSDNGSVIRPLVDNGFAVFAWDYPGFGLSNGTPTHDAIARTGQLAFDALLDRPDIGDSPKVLIYGFSIGAQSATKLARDNRQRVSALAIDAGMKSFLEMALLYSPEQAHEMIRKYMPVPYSSLEDITYLEGLPKAVFHSREDQVAPFAHGEEVFGAAPEPRRFIEYPGGHVSAVVAQPEETVGVFRSLLQ